jgi:hypothetical protein
MKIAIMRSCYCIAIIGAAAIAAPASAATQPGLFVDGAGRLACFGKPTGPCPTRGRDIDAKSSRTCTHAGHVYDINIPASMPITFMRCNP